MKNGDENSDTDDTMRYFAGGPRYNWTGKVNKQTLISVHFAHEITKCVQLITHTRYRGYL